MKPHAKTVEDAAAGASHCLTDMPYRMIVFARLDQNKVPLYLVAGAAGAPMGAEKALRLAHKTHGGACFYCKKPIEAGSATIDHAEPEARGGGKTLQNLILACRPCNAAKGYLPIEAFRADAGHEWLSALLKQVQDRLNRMR